MDENIIDVSDEFAISFLTDEDENGKIQDLSRTLDEYVKIVNGFLDKLASNPDAATIKWPDRINDISKLRQKLDKCLKNRF